MTLAQKACKVCQQNQPIQNFPKRGTYRLKSCEKCYKTSENRKYTERYRNDTEFNSKRRILAQRARIKYKYKTTPEEVYKTLDNQNYKCANLECQTEISFLQNQSFEKKAVIDHNHSNGKFRALLCQRCNLILGYLETRPQVVEGLQQYLKKHST